MGAYLIMAIPTLCGGALGVGVVVILSVRHDEKMLVVSRKDAKQDESALFGESARRESGPVGRIQVRSVVMFVVRRSSRAAEKA